MYEFGGPDYDVMYVSVGFVGEKHGQCEKIILFVFI